MIGLPASGSFSTISFPDRSGLEALTIPRVALVHQAQNGRLSFPKAVRFGTIPGLEAVRIDPGHWSAISA